MLRLKEYYFSRRKIVSTLFVLLTAIDELYSFYFWIVKFWKNLKPSLK